MWLASHRLVTPEINHAELVSGQIKNSLLFYCDNSDFIDRVNGVRVIITKQERGFNLPLYLKFGCVTVK
jgi:hypothetical protein